MTELLPHYQWLAGTEGATVLSSAQEMRDQGLADLKIGEVLRRDLDADVAALVLTQLDLRARAAEKFSRAGEMLFTRAGLEQSTSEAIATYRADRFRRATRIVELCCGIGGDLIALACLGIPVVAVDLDPVHLFLAEHNARLFHPDVDLTPLLMDVREVEILPSDSVFIDPARRHESGRRTNYLSEPPVEWSIELAEIAAGVAIKTAPGIPNDYLPEGWEMEHIALKGDLKEAVLWSPPLAGEFAGYPSGWPHRATVIVNQEAHSFQGGHMDIIQTVEPQPGQWLHDVNPAVTNAGMVRDLSAMLPAGMIDPEIGFLVTDHELRTPFTTSWQILKVLPWHEKRIKQALTALEIGPIDIRRRGLAGDVPTITKRLRGKGNRRALIAMTRMDDEPTAIICSMD